MMQYRVLKVECSDSGLVELEDTLNSMASDDWRLAQNTPLLVNAGNDVVVIMVRDETAEEFEVETTDIPF